MLQVESVQDPPTTRLISHSDIVPFRMEIAPTTPPHNIGRDVPRSIFLFFSFDTKLILFFIVFAVCPSYYSPSPTRVKGVEGLDFSCKMTVTAPLSRRTDSRLPPDPPTTEPTSGFSAQTNLDPHMVQSSLFSVTAKMCARLFLCRDSPLYISPKILPLRMLCVPLPQPSLSKPCQAALYRGLPRIRDLV